MPGHVNLLLAMMPPAIADELMASGGDFHVPNGGLIPGEQLADGQVFIVTGGIASKVQLASNGKISDVGMVGCDGFFPVSALLDVPAAPHIVQAQVGDLTGRRIRAKDFHRIVSEDEAARQVVLRYIYAFMAQICSTLLCSELPASARLARWLLMCHDRLPGDTVEVTHDTLASMTFAHRPTVTNTLHAFRKEGIIEMKRGVIRILDRHALEERTGGAYGMAEGYWHKYLGAFGKSEESIEVPEWPVQIAASR